MRVSVNGLIKSILFIPQYVFVVLLAASNGGPYTAHNTAFNYSVTFPSEDWRIVAVNDSQHYYYDTTDAYPALLSLVRYDVGDSNTAQGWTRSSFVAYLLATRYSTDPWGVLIYFDSSYSFQPVSGQGDSLWAPSSYSEWYSTDTGSAQHWNEYIRYCASNSYGYEMYALSDSSDMKQNIRTYVKILRSVTLPAHTNSARKIRYISGSAEQNGVSHVDGVFSIDGRCSKGGPSTRMHGFTIYLYNGKRVLNPEQETRNTARDPR